MSKNTAGVEVFNGFEIEYPEYSVVTPHSLKEFTIRTLTVGEEEKLKGSLLTPNRLASHLNQVIYSCICKKPDDIKTYEDFLNKLTIKDRDALMYGLYHVTYKDIHNYDVECGQCQHVNSVKINFEKSFRAKLWPKDSPKSAIDTEVSVKLQTAKNLTAIVKQPKLIDEDNLMKDSAFSSDELRDMNLQLLIISRFEIDRPESKAPDTLEDRDNIFKGYQQLPSTDRKLIDKAYLDNFGKYGVDVAARVKCQKCSHETDVTIDLVRQFFRAMYE